MYKPKLEEVLDATQIERLNQVSIQVAGEHAYSNPTVAKTLKFSKEQQEQMASIHQAFLDKMKEMGGLSGGGNADIFRGWKKAKNSKPSV